MSQATPPPVPPTNPYDPPPGLPAVAVAWPAYAHVARVTRPGVITAIGVTSIVVGSLSILANVYTALSLFVFSVVGPAANAMAAGAGGMGGPFPAGQAAPAAPAPSAQSANAVVVEAGGMEADARRAAAAALTELQFLSAGRLAQLDVLLAKSGRDIFPLDETPASPGAITKLVQAHGTSPSVDPNSTGSTYFRTPRGRMELYDDRAVFYPLRGADVVRTSTLTTTNPGLTPQQVQSVVQQAQATSGNALNPPQVAALTNLVSREGQQFVSPLTVQTAVRAAMVTGDGSVVVTFPNGVATFGPQGQTSSATGPNAAAPPFARPRINGAAMALASFATLATSALAIYLFVIGITTLRQSSRGRKTHLIYAVLKIPVTILGAAAAWWLTASFAEASLAALGPGAPMAGSFSDNIGQQQVILGVLGLIYPIVLLIVLQAKSVKDYYDSGVMRWE